jgi:aryl-alcohol dehydrogenase-like predicted oxidoreductase
MMGIQGYATIEGTRRLKDRFESAGKVAPGHFRESLHGLSLSSIGMGTYLGDTTEETDRLVGDAVIASVGSGAVNVIDTAINYRYQLAERAVGQALKQLLADGFQRDELFISTKNGYITPDAHSKEDFRAWFTQRFLQSGLITPQDMAGGIHCMAPAYLEDQLNRSLTNLGLETVDLMYLHNAAESQIPAVGRNTFMQRLEAAFEFYEQARRDNRIRWYGMATWECFRAQPEEATDYLSLETVVDLAHKVGGAGHGFRFIQLPFNLAFTEASDLQNQPVGNRLQSTLEAAADLGVGVFTSVPLLQGQLLNQGDLPRFAGLKTPAQHCLQYVRSYPGIQAPLVGHKTPAHVAENLAVAQVAPATLAQLREAFTARAL